jgi:hypothetical protein
MNARYCATVIGTRAIQKGRRMTYALALFRSQPPIR